MRNMFNGLNQKKKPKNLLQCTQGNPLSEELWSWARTQENIALYGGIIAAIITVIVFIGIGIDNEEPPVCIVGFFAGLLVGIIFYLVNHAHALRTAALAAIVHNTNISANINIYHEAKDEAEKLNPNFVKNNTTVQNQNDIDTSTVTSFEDKSNHIETQNSDKLSYNWKCSNCGNTTNELICPYCGKEYINL